MPQELLIRGTRVQWLVMTQINSCLSKGMDPLQFAHCYNRPTTDVIWSSWLSTLQRMDYWDVYVKICSLTTASHPSKHSRSHRTGLCCCRYNWILDFLSSGPSSLGICNNKFSSPMICIRLRAQSLILLSPYPWVCGQHSLMSSLNLPLTPLSLDEKRVMSDVGLLIMDELQVTSQTMNFLL